MGKQTSTKTNFVLKNKYEVYNEEKKGHKFTMESKTDKSRLDEVDIYRVIEKYNATGIMPKTRNEQPMYLDLTKLQNTSLNDLLKQREEMENYFNQMPAKVRKEFHDNVNEYIEEFRNGNLEKFIQYNALEEQQAEIIKKQREEFKKEMINQIKEEIQPTKEEMKGE